MIVLGDFSENYQFLVQEEVQSYHWSKEYCMLHPHFAYFIDVDGNIQHNSLWFIPDDNNHNTNSVYKILTILVDYLKEKLQIVDKIFYFSDGCAEQYKNCKNTFNLWYHQQDFNMDVEWIFFATSHSKSQCVGVGGFVKRYNVKCSLQRLLHDQTLSYKSMHDIWIREISSATFFCVSKEEIVNVCADSDDHLVPISCNKFAHKLTSEDRGFFNLILTNH